MVATGEEMAREKNSSRSGKSQGSSETSGSGNHVKHVHPFVIKHMLLRNIILFPKLFP